MNYPATKLMRVLLDRPEQWLTTREIVSKSGISSATAINLLKELVKLRILEMREEGVYKKYKLAETSIARELKKVYALYLVESFGVENLLTPGLISLALIGSFASGEYDSRSDIDLLYILSNPDEISRIGSKIKEFEKFAGRSIQIVKFPLHEWERKKKKKDPFIKTALANHFLLWGEPL